MSWRFCKSAFGLLLVGAAGSAAAQDYTAGKTPAQLFQSDCSACHKSPQGLARSPDQRALVNFLREHYTTKVESAGALAAYVLGAGVGAGAGQKPPAAGPAVPRPGVGIAEGEPGQRPRSRANATTEPRPGEGDNVRPAPRSRVVTAPPGPAAEPAPQPIPQLDEEGEPSITREDAPKRSPRAPLRDGAKPADAIATKLRSYGAAGGSAKETERLADPAKTIGSKVESYATSGSPAPIATPDGPKDAAPGETGAANTATVPAGAAANPPPKRKRSDRRRDATAGGAADAAGGAPANASASHSPRRPQRALGPIVQPPRGNN